MLNGVAPILIFHIYKKPPKSLAPGITDTAFFDDLTSLVGIPIPFYLSEEGFVPGAGGVSLGISTSGLIIDTEHSTIDLETEVEPREDKDLDGETKPPIVKQKSLDSTVSINLITKRDNVVLTALLALSNLVSKLSVSAEYGITYLNRSTTIFNGLLHRFSTSVDPNNDLIRIEMVLSNAKQASTKVKAAASTTVPKVAGESLNAGV